MKKLRLLLIFFALIKISFSQETSSISIKGRIINQWGDSVSNCYVKVHNAQSGIIYQYLNTGNKSHFNLSVSLPIPDSILVSVSHIAYGNYLFKSFVQTNETIDLHVVLPNKDNALEDVTVTAPPVWKKGDTTFYKVGVFKQGNEKKLKDLIVNIPDFELDENGKLLYKKNPVDKILIDGEEIFSDKLDLLLNNFPIHVLSTVQAIQNQNNNRLLKGLVNEGKIFLNLGLSKEKLKAAFGDGEAGIGTEGKYSFSPVVFSLYGKIKMGFIGQWNNIGNGIGILQENEIKNKEEQYNNIWMMNNHPIRRINNFENRWYIKNNLWDNRLQFNLPVSKNIKTKTELIFLNDNQKQFIYNHSFNTSDTGFVEVVHTSEVNYRPAIFKINHSGDFSIDSNSSLQYNLSFYKDGSKGFQNGYYNFIKENDYSQRSILKNNQQSLSANLVSTNRLSDKKAQIWVVNYNYQNIQQNGLLNSPDLPFIFNMPYDFTKYNNRFNHHIQGLSLDFSEHLKSKKCFLNYGIHLNYYQIFFNVNTEIQSEKEVKNLDTVFNQQSPSSIKYYKSNLFLSSQLKPSFLQKPINYILKAGIIQLEEQKQSALKQIYPTVELMVKNDHDLFNQLKATIDFKFKNEAFDPHLFYHEYYPKNLNDIKRISVDKKEKYTVEAIYAFSKAFADFSNAFLLISYNYNNKSWISTYKTLGFFNQITDSLISKASETFHISSHYQMPSLLLKAKLEVGLVYNHTKTFLLFNEKVYPAKFNWYVILFNLSKNWQKRYFLSLNSRYSIYEFNTSYLSDNNVSKSSNLSIALNQRIILNSQIQIKAGISYFLNNLFTKDKAAFIFSDIEAFYQVKNSKWSFTLRTDNLFSEKNYYNYFLSAKGQNFSKIPLEPFTLFASARVNF